MNSLFNTPNTNSVVTTGTPISFSNTGYSSAVYHIPPGTTTNGMLDAISKECEKNMDSVSLIFFMK